MKRTLSLALLSLATLVCPAIAEEALTASPDVAAAVTEAAMVVSDTPAAVADSGNTAWLLVCSALVMLMTPGLAFFYAGMVSRKNVVSTLLQNYVALAVIGVLWVVVGYSLAFSQGNGFIGGLGYTMLNGLTNVINPTTGIPEYAFVAFQMMFAIITPALFTGAIAERVHFRAWISILALWSLCVYSPVAHWVWGVGGWLFDKGALDFAGGLVVHLTAGIAALIAAIMFGKRHNPSESAKPNDISMIMLGAALLWFGWFGFNAGSALTSGALASHAFLTTFIGAATAFIAWMATDWIRLGKPSATGAAIGLVVGLVVITPAAGYVSITSAILMTAIAGVVCNLVAVAVKHIIKVDDALDVFACHGVGGLLGAIMTGLFAEKAINGAVVNQGFFIDGSTTLLMANLTGVGAVALYTAVVTFLLIKIVGLFTPIRVSKTEEQVGLDTSVHGETSRYHAKGYETANK